MGTDPRKIDLPSTPECEGWGLEWHPVSNMAECHAVRQPDSLGFQQIPTHIPTGVLLAIVSDRADADPLTLLRMAKGRFQEQCRGYVPGTPGKKHDAWCRMIDISRVIAALESSP